MREGGKPAKFFAMKTHTKLGALMGRTMQHRHPEVVAIMDEYDDAYARLTPLRWELIELVQQGSWLPEAAHLEMRELEEKCRVLRSRLLEYADSM